MPHYLIYYSHSHHNGISNGVMPLHKSPLKNHRCLTFSSQSFHATSQCLLIYQMSHCPITIPCFQSITPLAHLKAPCPPWCHTLFITVIWCLITVPLSYQNGLLSHKNALLLYHSSSLSLPGGHLYPPCDALFHHSGLFFITTLYSPSTMSFSHHNLPRFHLNALVTFLCSTFSSQCTSLPSQWLSLPSRCHSFPPEVSKVPP